MTRILPAALLMLSASCATSTTVYVPLRDISWQAMGWTPAWLLSIGDNRIVVSMAGDDHVWPRVLPRTVDGVTIWQSGSGDEGITITARPGPCHGQRWEGQSASEETYDYQQHVTVRIGNLGREYRGCGGRLLPRGEDR